MVLKTIMDKMNEINRKVEGLHLESMQAVNATQDYAEHVEAAMKVRCAHRVARVRCRLRKWQQQACCYSLLEGGEEGCCIWCCIWWGAGAVYGGGQV